MHIASTVLFVFSYLLAFADGVREDGGTYPSSPGPVGVKRFAKGHPWLVAGGLCGIAGLVVDVVWRKSRRPSGARWRLRSAPGVH